MDGRPDGGLVVVPRRVGDSGDGGPGHRRGRSLWVALVIAAAAAIVGVAWLGPRLSDRPSFDVSFFATPTPTLTLGPSPTIIPFGPVLPTPLPAVTRPDGAIVAGRVAVETDAMHVLDLATGMDVSGPPVQIGRDAAFRTPSADGWTCICFDDRADGAVQNRVAQVTQTDSTGAVTDSTDIGIFKFDPGDETRPADLQTDVDVYDGGRRAILGLLSRTGGVWAFEVAAVDVDGRRLGPIVDVGSTKAPSPPPVPGPSESGAPVASGAADPSPTDLAHIYVDGPHVRVSPEGTAAFIWAAIQRSDITDTQVATEIHAWRVVLGADGSIGAVTPATGFDDLPQYCSSVGFAARDRLAWLCPVFGAASGDLTWRFGTMDLLGRTVGAIQVASGPNGAIGPPLFDRANGQAYAWDQNDLSIVRIDVHSLAIARATFDPLAQAAPGTATPGGSLDPDWHDADSSARQIGFSTISGGLGVADLYALGFDRQPAVDSGAQPSLGVFVIDRFTLGLMDRWAADAEYVSLSTLPDGRVAASGQAALNQAGHGAPWEASLTIHDPLDGRILVRFGRLGDNSAPLAVDR